MYLSTNTSTQDLSEMYLSTFQVLYKLYLSTDVLRYKVLLPGSGYKHLNPCSHGFNRDRNWSRRSIGAKLDCCFRQRALYGALVAGMSHDKVCHVSASTITK